MLKWLHMGNPPLLMAELDVSDPTGGGGGDPAPSGGGDGDGASGDQSGSGDSGASGGEGDGSSSSSSASYPGFHSQYPPDVRGHEALKDENGEWLDPGTIVREAIDYRTKRDRLIERPGEDATAEQRDAFARAIGRPKGPEGYDLRKPDDWPNTVPWSEEGAKRFAERAFKAGVPKDVAERMFQETVTANRGAYVQQLDKQQQHRAENDQKLRDEWKDDLDRALHTADRAMTLIGEPAVADKLKRAGLDRDPDIVRMLNKAWNNIGEDKIFSGAVDSTPNGTSSRKQQIRKRYANTKFDG